MPAYMLSPGTMDTGSRGVQGGGRTEIGEELQTLPWAPLASVLLIPAQGLESFLELRLGGSPFHAGEQVGPRTKRQDH